MFGNSLPNHTRNPRLGLEHPGKGFPTLQVRETVVLAECMFLKYNSWHKLDLKNALKRVSFD